MLASAAAVSTASALQTPSARLLGAVARRVSKPDAFTTPLRLPRELRGAEITIPIVAAKQQILPGPKTALWTYDGSFPGPTIRRPAGATTRVSFEHHLPAAAGELTVHLHGGHVASDQDGQPGGLTAAQPRAGYCRIDPNLSPTESGNDLLIAPGGRRTYNYELTEAGEPERAAFQWYHDHRLERTAANIWRGLAGMFIVDDDLDAALGLPRGRRDIALMLSDRSFDRQNQLTDPFSGRPPSDGSVGEHVLVNGRIRPFHRVDAARYRLRLLNGSHFRSYRLSLTPKLRVHQIATESGLIPAPLSRDQILIGPGERVELVVDFSSARGERVRLRSTPRPGPFGPDSRSWDGELVEFRVADHRGTDNSSLPRQLRPLPAWTASAPRTPSHTWKITLSGDFNPRWLINNRSFDPSYSDISVPIGSTVCWEIANRTSVPHLFHLHSTDWLLLARNGVAPPLYEQALKETFLIDPYESVLIAGRLTDHLGKYVVHCHMLDHEDHGLMSQFEVV